MFHGGGKRKKRKRKKKKHKNLFTKYSTSIYATWCAGVFPYLLLLHSLFVRFLHLVHLHPHIGLLVLKVCFQLCELEGNLMINTSNKCKQTTVTQHWLISTGGQARLTNLPFGPSLEWFDPSAAEVSWVTSLPLSAGWWEWSCLFLQNPSTGWWNYWWARGESMRPVPRWASQCVEEKFRHLMFSQTITTLVVPVPVGWLHLQFWFLLWSLLLDWRRFMAAQKIKMAMYNLVLKIQSRRCLLCITQFQMRRSILPLLPQSLLLLGTQAPT